MESNLIPYHAVTAIPAQRVLVLAPHPDDEVFGCGGTICKHVDGGTDVDVIVLTDGALYADPAVRCAESTRAAKLLGYGTPEFWGYPDGGLQASDDLVQRLADRIAQTGTDLVFAPSPWELHPDHQQTQVLAVKVAMKSSPDLRLAFYEVGAPLQPNLLVDITTATETKLAAMRCFESQLLHQDYLAHIQALNCYRTYTLPRQVLAAEAFWILPSSELDRVSWSDIGKLFKSCN